MGLSLLSLAVPWPRMEPREMSDRSYTSNRYAAALLIALAASVTVVFAALAHAVVHMQVLA